MTHTVHEYKEAALKYAHRFALRVPQGFNVNVPYIGTSAAELLREIQHQHRIPATGKLDAATVRALDPLFGRDPEPPDPRHLAAGQLWWAYEADQAGRKRGVEYFPYGAGPGGHRPVSIDAWIRKLLPQPLNDCSGTLICAGHASGYFKAAGFGAGGYGNTETMLAGFHHRALVSECEIFDWIIFGGDPDRQHAVAVLQPGRDPLVWSHGQPGILVWRLSTEARYHEGQPIIALDTSRPV